MRRNWQLALVSLAALVAASVTLAGEPPMPVDAIHIHKEVPLPEGARAPRLEAALYPDAIDGFNLEIRLADYELGMPARQGEEPPALQPNGVLRGHAHLFINGEKVARLYATQFHIKRKWLSDGVNQVTVTLNSHTHDTWAVDEKPFLATVFVDPTREDPVMYRFSSSPP